MQPEAKYFLIGLSVASLVAGAFSYAHAQPANSPYAILHPKKSTAASASAAVSGAISQIQQFTVSDLTAALADANAQTPPDTRHGACWQALIPFAQQTINNPLPSGLGLAQLAQKSFDVQARLGQPLVPDSVVTACALTVYDLKIDFAKLAALAGVAVAAPISLPAGL